MGDITIHVISVGAGNDHKVLANCTATLDSGQPGETIQFQCEWDYDAAAATVNAAIVDTAIAEAASQASYTVGALDSKTLLGGAVML